MVRMRERYTGIVFNVADGLVEKRLQQGYSMVDGPEPRSEPEPVLTPESVVPEPEPDEPKPTEDSTISEIRAYAKRHGIALPKGGKKVKLLELLRE